MSFANPLFFWGLLSLAVPIAIHLFRFRRFRTVFFTNVRFLQELKKETQSHSRLRHLLILLMRCLALAALVFAFARPYLPGNMKSIAGERAVSIYIDNSYSMDAQGQSSSLLDLAKKHALDIVSAGQPSDRYQLITNDFEGQHQRLLSAEQFKQAVSDIKPSASVKKIADVIMRQSDLLRNSGIANKTIFLLSDFQSNISNFQESKPDSTINLNCIHLEAALADNISIDSAWFENPYREKKKPETLWFSASNHSGKRFDNIPVKLIVDGTQRGLESLILGPDSTQEKGLVFTTENTGFHSAYLEITDFPIVFDDRYFISWNTPENINVLCINGTNENPYLNQLFSKNPAFTYHNSSVQQVDFGSLSRQECIILNEVSEISSGMAQELKKFIEAGGTLLVFPSLNTELNSWTSFLGSVGAGVYAAPVNQHQKVGTINSHHLIYDDVFEKAPVGIDLPQANTYLPIRSVSNSREEPVMQLQNGDRFLTEFYSGKGKIFLCATPLNEAAGNFQKHALFIPSIYKIALYSLPPVQLSYTIGDGSAIPIGSLNINADQTLKMRSDEAGIEIIPEHRIIDGKVWIYPGNRIQQAGNYKLLLGNQEVARLAFNYSRQESQAERLTSSELEKRLHDAGWSDAKIFDGAEKELQKTIAQSDQGKPLWKFFIILALIFLAAETLIIRFIK